MALVLEENPYENFLYALRAPESKRQYPRRFKVFLDFLQPEVQKVPFKEIEKQANRFYSLAIKDKNWVNTKLKDFVSFQIKRAIKGEISYMTIRNYYRATKLFCEMNEIELSWKKISRGIPKGREYGDDRIPTIEEIRKIIEYPDRRIKAVVSMMVSGGFRLGSWEYLKWKHIKPIEKKGTIVAAKVLIYAGESEEYFTFITPEAYKYLKEWMECRISYGEKISDDSFIFRDMWQTTDSNTRNMPRHALNPKRISTFAVKRMIERAIWAQGLRKPLQHGAKRHEFKSSHGFRKFFKTFAEQVMKPVHVELLLGHNIGLSGAYYKPTENQLLEDYLNAVNLLTINEENSLKKKVEELTEKQDEISYLKFKYEQDMKAIRKEMESKFNRILSKIDVKKLG
jgi:hypothetical protein